jgi:hypothetical protein
MRTVFPTRELRDEAVEKHHAGESAIVNSSTRPAFTYEVKGGPAPPLPPVLFGSGIHCSRV